MTLPLLRHIVSKPGVPFGEHPDPSVSPDEISCYSEMVHVQDICIVFDSYDWWFFVLGVAKKSCLLHFGVEDPLR